MAHSESTTFLALGGRRSREIGKPDSAHGSEVGDAGLMTPLSPEDGSTNANANANANVSTVNTVSTASGLVSACSYSPLSPQFPPLPTNTAAAAVLSKGKNCRNITGGGSRNSSNTSNSDYIDNKAKKPPLPLPLPSAGLEISSTSPAAGTPIQKNEKFMQPQSPLQFQRTLLQQQQQQKQKQQQQQQQQQLPESPSSPRANPSDTSNNSTAPTTTPRQLPNLQAQLARLSIKPSPSVESPSAPSPTPAASRVSVNSPFSPQPPLSQYPPVFSHKRAAHMRSKSYQFPGTITPQSPTTGGYMSSSSRQFTPPLIRSASLPGYTATTERRYPTSLPKMHSGWHSTSPLPSSSGSPLQNYKLRDRSPSRQFSPVATSTSSLLNSSPSAVNSHSTVIAPPPAWANEPHPANSSYQYSPSVASSSCPSTPTSLRSRSPSISSLETIPDSPDAEAEALEAERLAEEAANQAATMKRSISSPISEKTLRRRSHVGMDGLGGTGLMSMEKRKRWSVCGGEKRADLELETIWEDSVVAVQSPPQECLNYASTFEEDTF